jgi:hypothetical protein
MGEKRKAYTRLLLGKLEGNRPLGRRRRRWVDKNSAFNEGGNTTTGYGAVNISLTLQLSLPIAE